MIANDHVVVIGAGVSGLTTAIVLAEAGATVRMIAEEVPGVTSLAAGAVWGPYLVEPKDKVARWSRHSLEVFGELAADPATGVRLTSGIEASRHADAPPDWATALPEFRPCTATELPPGTPPLHCSSGRHAGLPRLPPAAAGGRGSEGRTARLRSLAEVGPDAAVINCTGMGAHDLVPDPELRPIRGQHVVVSNPGLTEFFSEDTGLSPELLCIYPHGDTVVLGGTAVDGVGDVDADDAAAKSILARCTLTEPRLADAQIIEHRIGARPTRDIVRVESDRLEDGTVVVHNYGHGGAGVTLSWGCAENVLTLLGER